MGKRGRPVTVWLDDGVASRLDSLAVSVGVTRSRLIASLLTVASEEMELLRGIDSLRLSFLLPDLRCSLHERLRDPESVQEACGDGVSS
jgi:hypothetical protein